jgi:hypothetical protein
MRRAIVSCSISFSPGSPNVGTGHKAEDELGVDPRTIRGFLGQKLCECLVSFGGPLLGRSIEASQFCLGSNSLSEPNPRNHAEASAVPHIADEVFAVPRIVGLAQVLTHAVHQNPAEFRRYTACAASRLKSDLAFDP